MALQRMQGIDRVKESTSSDGSRSDAKPARAKFASYMEEWDSLVTSKQQIQQRLTQIGRDMGKHHAAIRSKDLPQAESYAAWMKVKGPLEKEQLDLTTDLHAAEARMREIKPHVRREKQVLQRQESQSDGVGMMRNDLLSAILSEVKAIRSQLEKRNV